MNFEDDSLLLNATQHEAPAFGQAVVAIVSGDDKKLRDLLTDSPALAAAHSKSDHGATLLHYIASNAVEDILQLHPRSAYQQLTHGAPAVRPELTASLLNICDLLVHAGAVVDAPATGHGGGPLQTTLNWLVSSSHPAKAKLTAALVEKLCQLGALPNGAADDCSPLTTALLFGVTDAVPALIAAGGRTDNLLLAAAAGDTSRVASDLKSPASSAAQIAQCETDWFHPPKDPDVAAQWAWIFAAMTGQVDVMKLLLSHGVDRNCSPKISHVTATALHTACLSGQHESVQYLIEQNCDPTLLDAAENGSPRRWASWGGDLNILRRAGHYEADFVRVRERTNDAITEFVEAVFAKDLVALKEVLKNNPLTPEQLNAPWFHFDTPAVVQVKEELELVDCLIAAGADINQKSLWWAGGFGVLDDTSPSLAEELIQRGARLDIWSASELGKLSELETMLAPAPNLINARGPDGKMALHVAASPAVASFLLEQGAQIDARCLDHNSTPLQYAAVDRQDVAKHLIDRGAQSDIMAAAALGCVDTVKSILTQNPDAASWCIDREHFPSDAADCIYSWTLGWYKTPHQVANRFGHNELAQLLFDASSPEAAYLNALLLDRPDIISNVLAQDSDLPSKLPPSITSHLAHAARNNAADLVARLLEGKFSVAAVGQHGATALHWAGFHGNVEMIRCILQNDPPLKDRDAEFGTTPLGWVHHGSTHGWHRHKGDYGQSAELLIQAGCQADPEWPPTGIAAIDQAIAAARPTS